MPVPSTTGQGAVILVVDDDASFREPLAMRLERKGYPVRGCGTGDEALKIARGQSFPLALIDIRMPGMDGLTLLKALKEVDALVEVVILTGYATVETAIEAMKLGAYDYLTKPFDHAKLDLVIEKAYQKWELACHARALEGEVARLSSALKERYSFHAIVGKSAPLQEVYDRIEAASRTRSTIMIVGESGTGKELAARAIHYAGPEADRPFIAVNCAALPGDLIESELFGHRRGSFTSATGDTAGLFKAAEGGSLLLDEVTEMAADTQAKLLRVLQEKAVRPVGSTWEVPVNVRVIASSNRDLSRAVAQGKLREDLYYRLAVATIRMPPLRERMEDLPLLVAHFIQRFNQDGQRRIEGVDRRALEAMMRYHWPGNVRELANVVESAFMFRRTARITRADLPPRLLEEQWHPPAQTLPSAGLVPLKEAERLLIVRAMEQFQGNKSHVARALGISRKQLYVKLAAYGLHGPGPNV